MADVSPELRERFLDRFFLAWPDRDIPEEFIRSRLKLTIETDEGSVLVAELLGCRSEYGFANDEELLNTIDDIAKNLAENAEGDRWTLRGGWREWRA